jgi:hypothetical protein
MEPFNCKVCVGSVKASDLVARPLALTANNKLVCCKKKKIMLFLSRAHCSWLSDWNGLTSESDRLPSFMQGAEQRRHVHTATPGILMYALAQAHLTCIVVHTRPAAGRPPERVPPRTPTSCSYLQASGSCPAECSLCNASSMATGA